MSKTYILEGHRPKRTETIKWAKWYEKADRSVAQSFVRGATISTVFLGVDYGQPSGPPLLFETMVFGGPLDGEIERYTTWDQAAVGHAGMVQRVAQHE